MERPHFRILQVVNADKVKITLFSLRSESKKSLLRVKDEQNTKIMLGSLGVFFKLFSLKI